MLRDGLVLRMLLSVVFVVLHKQANTDRRSCAALTIEPEMLGPTRPIPELQGLLIDLEKIK